MKKNLFSEVPPEYWCGIAKYGRRYLQDVHIACKVESFGEEKKKEKKINHILAKEKKKLQLIGTSRNNFSHIADFFLNKSTLIQKSVFMFHSFWQR